MHKGFFEETELRCLRCSDLIGSEPIGYETPLGPLCSRCTGELLAKRKAREEASRDGSMVLLAVAS
jgi:hypothetical protein